MFDNQLNKNNIDKKISEKYKINKIKYKHRILNNLLDYKYNFKEIWENQCSKYNSLKKFVLPKVSRIIVIGDIHGDWDRMIKLLNIAKLIDKDDNWVGGNTVVVQVGDQIDRCRSNNFDCHIKDVTIPDEGNDWKILQYFTNLHNQAIKVGGAVYSLLGNHELMNVQQNLDYVSYEGFNEFNNFKTSKGNIIKDGRHARQWAFQKGNDISIFLACTRNVALIIGSNLFVHAGILDKIAKKYDVTNINKLMTLYLLNKLKNIDDYQDLFDANTISPLWNRVFGKLALISKNYNINNYNPYLNKICNKLMLPLNKIYNIDKIYVGHTPIIDYGISNVCNNKIWITDYGMSKAFDKFKYSNKMKIQVLEILNDGAEINILEETL